MVSSDAYVVLTTSIEILEAINIYLMMLMLSIYIYFFSLKILETMANVSLDYAQNRP